MKRGTVREDGKVLLRTHYGQQIWGTVEQYNRLVATQYRWVTERRLKSKLDKQWRIGEQDPETGLYFIRTMGNYKLKFGTLEELEEFRVKRKNIFKNYKEKKHKNTCIYKRGDIDPILNLYFWKYNTQSGNPIWYTKEMFLAKLAKEKEYRRKRYARTGK